MYLATVKPKAPQ